MTRIRLTPAARDDLSSVWDFTCDRWDARQAKTYLLDINEAFERLATDPERGRHCDDIRSGYRKYPAGSHLIFFVAHEDGIDVIRILHQRMDPTRHL